MAASVSATPEWWFREKCTAIPKVEFSVYYNTSTRYSFVTGSEKTPLIAQKIKIYFFARVESTMHTGYTTASSVVIAHSFPEL